MINLTMVVASTIIIKRIASFIVIVIIVLVVPIVIVIIVVACYYCYCYEYWKYYSSCCHSFPILFIMLFDYCSCFSYDFSIM